MFHSHKRLILVIIVQPSYVHQKMIEWSFRAWILELTCVGSSAFSMNIILVMDIEASLINFLAIV